jgi:predicted NBD/HSP70 family sugar kinase
MVTSQPFIGYAVAPGELYAQYSMPDNGGQYLSLDSKIPSQQAVLQTIADDVRQRNPQPTSVGISVPGHIDSGRGVVVFGPGLGNDGEDWENESIGQVLRERARLPVVIDNDANCILYYYSKKDEYSAIEDLIAVYLGPENQGLGGAIITGGKMIRGSRGAAGEFGHVVVQPTGARCRCKSRGCLEAVLSIENVAREINWGERHTIETMDQAVARVEAGDSAAKFAFERAGMNFGQGLAVLFNLFDPELVIVGGRRQFLQTGSPTESTKIFKDAYLEALEEYAFTTLKRDCRSRVRVVEMGLAIAASGAGLMAADRTRIQDAL